MRGERRFPGELRLPGIVCLLRAGTRVEAAGRSRCEIRYLVSSRSLSATEAAEPSAGTGRSRVPQTHTERSSL